MIRIRTELTGIALSILLGGIIGMVCAFLIPAYFAGGILFAGIVAGALVGGYLGARMPTATTRVWRIAFAVCYGAVAAMIVCYVSLLIILNVRGS